jgi:hypothetical protein
MTRLPWILSSVLTCIFESMSAAGSDESKDVAK